VDTLSAESLRQLYGQDTPTADLIQVAVTYEEWLELAQKLQATPWHYIRENALQWLIRHSVLVDGGYVLVL
jgi:hypothetical protein